MLIGDGDEREQRRYSNGEINRELTTLKRILNLARQNGRLMHVPHVPMLKERNVRPRDCHRQVRTPRPSVEPSSARPHEVGEHKLRGRPADLLTGLLIELVMNAAINAGHGFFFGGLPETVEVPCDAG